MSLKPIRLELLVLRSKSMNIWIHLRNMKISQFRVPCQTIQWYTSRHQQCISNLLALLVHGHWDENKIIFLSPSNSTKVASKFHLNEMCAMKWSSAVKQTELVYIMCHVLKCYSSVPIVHFPALQQFGEYYEWRLIQSRLLVSILAYWCSKEYHRNFQSTNLFIWTPYPAHQYGSSAWSVTRIVTPHRSVCKGLWCIPSTQELVWGISVMWRIFFCSLILTHIS